MPVRHVGVLEARRPLLARALAEGIDIG